MLTKQLTNESKLIQGPVRTEHSHRRGKAPIGQLLLGREKEVEQQREGKRGPSEGGFSAREACSG